MTDIRQSVHYANYMAKIGWQVEESAGIYYFVRKLPLIGSVLKIQRPEEIRIKKIKELAKKYHTFTIIVEPKTELDAKFLKSVGYKVTKPYSPTKTLQLDLTKDKNLIFRRFKKDAKYALQKTKSLKVEGEKDIEKFRNAWKKAVGWKRYVPPTSHLIALKKTFKTNCFFLSCINASKEIVTGGIFLRAEKIAYYWQAFTSSEGRQLQAQYKIVWEGILWAKGRGAKIFDFEGIFDPRFPDKSWLGFSHFKKSFGGYEKEYPGCYVKNRFPL